MKDITRFKISTLPTELILLCSFCLTTCRMYGIYLLLQMTLPSLPWYTLVIIEPFLFIKVVLFTCQYKFRIAEIF